MTRALVFDPGGTTGWSKWEYTALEPGVLLEYGQIPGGVRGFSRWAVAYLEEETPDEIISESFVDDGRTEHPDITPLRIEGAIEALFGVLGIPIIWQENKAKAHGPDELLKANGLWFVGQPHATDTARHFLASMKVRDHRPTMARFWPRRRPPLRAA